MKKYRFMVFLLFSLMLILTGCTFTKEHSIEDAKKLAKETFGLETILIASPGSSASQIMLDSTSRYPIYVLGMNDEGEEVFVIVPVLKSQEPYIVDWPFIKSFEKIVQQLNDSYGDVLTSVQYDQIELIDNDLNMHDPNIDVDQLDVIFMMCYDEYSIVQINGQIVIEDKRFER